MVGFYKHDIPAWMDGTEGLSDGAYRAYHVIVQLIMLHEGPVTLNVRGIAGRCNQTAKVFQRHLDELLASGKLTLIDGQLSNARAATELQFVMQNRANAGKGGKTQKKSRETRQKPQETGSFPRNTDHNPLKNNRQGQAPLSVVPSLKDERREDLDREEARTRAAQANRESFPPDAFDRFWTLYPEKVGTLAARTAFEAVRISGRVAFRTLVDGLVRYKATKPRRRQWCSPVKWLEEGRWEDQLADDVDQAADPKAVTAGNGFSQLAYRKAQGDDSAYHDPYARYDRPRAGEARGADDLGGAGAHLDDPLEGAA